MIGFPGTTELMIIGGLGLLIFGTRLPKIARSFGSTIIEFKKGLRGVNEELDISDVKTELKEIKSETKKLLDKE